MSLEQKIVKSALVKVKFIETPQNTDYKAGDVAFVPEEEAKRYGDAVEVLGQNPYNLPILNYKGE